MRRTAQRRSWRSGFSLIEVVVATGLCTYALVVIACLMPIGLATVQSANMQIVETEIFNRIGLEVNTIPFYDLPFYPRFKGGYPSGSVMPATYSAGGQTGLCYFDKDGGELSTATGAVYLVYCSLIYPGANSPSNMSSTLSATRLGALGPPVDGKGTIATSAGGSGLALVQIQIGFHADPSTLATTDPRFTSRTFVIAKRDTSNGS
jgi:hypothetical protein